jgi:hypothetical protein
MITTLLPAHKAAADFHDHLDECEQCREQPFNLCATGDRLIKACVVKPYKLSLISAGAAGGD